MEQQVQAPKKPIIFSAIQPTGIFTLGTIWVRLKTGQSLQDVIAASTPLQIYMRLQYGRIR